MNSILADKIAKQFKSVDGVEAIALGGSQATGSIDKHSDIDLYVYSDEIIPLNTRQAIVEKLGASRPDLNLTFWDLGDEWFDMETGTEIDVIYWDKSWVEGQINRLLVSCQGSVGYSTSFWYTVLNSKVLFDRQSWFADLQEKCDQPYPEQLRRAVIAKNHPVLRTVIPSYNGQIKKAIERRDLISLNHRLTALWASYFDVLFAVNLVLNPGEKKVLEFVSKHCSKVPKNLPQRVEAILKSAVVGDRELLHLLDELLDDLDELLIAERIDPIKTIFLDKNI